MTDNISDKLQTIAENVPKVYDAGVTVGKKAEYEAFCNEYQDGGNRGDYSHAYGGIGWTNKTLTPNHDIIPTSAYMIFRQCAFEGDLVEHFKALDVKLDLSKATNTGYMFALASGITHVGVIDVSNSTSNVPMDCCFQNCSSLVTIDKICLKKGKISEFNSSSFLNCKALKNLTIEGTIYTTIDIKSSPLTAESAKSVLTHLEDYSGTDSEFDYSVLFHANVWALLDAEGNTAPHGGTWADYVDTLGWNR